MSIIAVVQNQLLQTLFKALDLASLENGQEVEARVVSTTSDGKATLDIGGKQITANFQNTAALSAALVPGSRVGLKVDFSRDEPRLVLTERTNATVSRTSTAGLAVEATEAEPSLLLGAAIETPAARFKPPIEIFKFVDPEVAAKAEVLLAAPNPRTVLLQSAINAVLKQNGAGTLIADLEALLNPPGPAEQAAAEAAGTVPLQARPLPAPLFNAALAVLRGQLDGDEPVLAQDFKQAFKQSGLFLEAQLGKGNAPSPTVDFKAALLSLKDVAQKLLSTLQTPEAEIEQAKPFQAAESLLRNSPPAPRRDAPPEPQRSAESLITAQTETRDAINIIASHTEQALERLKLLQFASLPPSPDNPVANQAQKNNAQVWAFEVPVRFPQETAVAGFKIEHDRDARGGPTGSKLWRVNFALETAELGAVQGSIGLRGAQLAIALFAERRETAEVFRGAASGLKDSLSASQFELTDFSILTGKPAHPSPGPGYFVNSAA